MYFQCIGDIDSFFKMICDFFNMQNFQTDPNF